MGVEVHGGGICGSELHRSEYGAVTAGTRATSAPARGAAELLNELRPGG